MKKLSTYLFLILFSFSAPSFGDDISEYQIEGISIGDSLLDHLSKQEIINEIEINKHAYNYLNDDFGEVYLRGKFDIYDWLSFLVKPKDKNYIIYFIKSSINYNDKVKQCYAKQKEIVEEFSLLYKNTKKVEKTALYPNDPTGKSNIYYVQFIFDTGDAITVSCRDFKGNFKIKNNYVDTLSVELSNKEAEDWLSNY